jgi:AAA domain
MMYGPPKCYKSFSALDAMLHVAKGWEWHDRAVQQGAVIYCAFEGAHGYKKRAAALRIHYELADDDPTPLFIISGNANLIQDKGTLIRDIQQQLNELKPVAVVLDTLNKSLHGSESKDVDMSNYIRAAEAIRDAFGCVVVIVHHTGLDETRPRGHTALPGAVDAQLIVNRTGEHVTIEVEFMRDGPEGTIVTGVAKVIEVGVDGNGKPLSSLVIVPVDKPAEVHKRRDWPRGLIVFRDALSEAILSHGRDFQIEDGPKVRATNLERVREVFYRIYHVKDSEQLDKKQLQNARRQAFHRSLKNAQDFHLIGVRVLPDDQEICWLAVTRFGEV